MGGSALLTPRESELFSRRGKTLPRESEGALPHVCPAEPRDWHARPSRCSCTCLSPRDAGRTAVRCDGAVSARMANLVACRGALPRSLGEESCCLARRCRAPRAAARERAGLACVLQGRGCVVSGTVMASAAGAGAGAVVGGGQACWSAARCARRGGGVSWSCGLCTGLTQGWLQGGYTEGGGGRI